MLNKPLNFAHLAYDWIWEKPIQQRSRPMRALVDAIRVLWVVLRDVAEGRLNLQAMSLVYTTLVALVPTLAISFALFRAFGYDAYVEQFLTEFLAPLGDQGAEIRTRVLDFVDRANSRVLGGIGAVFLIYVVISMIRKIEVSFNEIWRTQITRSLAQQVKDIVSLGVLGPLVLVMGLTFMASAMSTVAADSTFNFGPVRYILSLIASMAPYIVVIAGLTLLYMIVPSTRVRPFSALCGALVASIVWNITGWAFATFVVSSAQYAAIYSAFASLIIFLLWLYAVWLILLAGCAVSYYVENRHHLSPVSGILALSMQQEERVAALIIAELHRSFAAGNKGWTEPALADTLGVPVEVLSRIANKLERAGFVTRTNRSPIRLLPAKPAQLTPLIDVLASQHLSDATYAMTDAAIKSDATVDEIFNRVHRAQREALEGATAADLVDGTPPSPVPQHELELEEEEEELPPIDPPREHISPGYGPS